MNVNYGFGNNAIENTHNTVEDEKEVLLEKVFKNVGKDPSNSSLLMSEEDEKEEMERQEKKERSKTRVACPIPVLENLVGSGKACNLDEKKTCSQVTKNYY